MLTTNLKSHTVIEKGLKEPCGKTSITIHVELSLPGKKRLYGDKERGTRRVLVTVLIVYSCEQNMVKGVALGSI